MTQTEDMFWYNPYDKALIFQQLNLPDPPALLYWEGCKPTSTDAVLYFLYLLYVTESQNH